MKNRPTTRPTTVWTDDVLRVLRTAYRSGGMAAARAAFPDCNEHTLHARITGMGGPRSIKDLDVSEKIGEMRRVVVRGRNIDTAGLIDLIHRGRRAS